MSFLTPTCAGSALPGGMETVNALELRRSLGRVLDHRSAAAVRFSCATAAHLLRLS